jgi:MmyB-like transcription regulator ligand binding domain
MRALMALHPSGMAARVANFAEWAPHVTEGLRRECARNPEPALEVLLTELEGCLAGISRASEEPAVAVPLSLRIGRQELRLVTTLTSFVTATDAALAEIRLEAFLPADQQSADVLNRLARRRDAAS